MRCLLYRQLLTIYEVYGLSFLASLGLVQRLVLGLLSLGSHSLQLKPSVAAPILLSPYIILANWL